MLFDVLSVASVTLLLGARDGAAGLGEVRGQGVGVRVDPERIPAPIVVEHRAGPGDRRVGCGGGLRQRRS
jgi:hypothetical protein